MTAAIHMRPVFVLVAAMAVADASPRSSAPRAPSGDAVGALSQWTRKLLDKQEELWREQQAAWQRRLTRGGRPPNGAIYVGTMSMPVIGRQTFMLRVLNGQRCQIVLIGP